MFSRIQFKENAKQLLRRYYWMAFAVCTIYVIIHGIGTSTITGKITVNFRGEIPIFWHGGFDLLHASWVCPHFFAWAFYFFDKSSHGWQKPVFYAQSYLSLRFGVAVFLVFFWKIFKYCQSDVFQSPVCLAVVSVVCNSRDCKVLPI